MEKLQWFKFSPTDWGLGKIQRCPEITQARYIRLCCLYWNKEGGLSYEDAEIDIEAEHLNILVAKKIVERVGDGIIIKFLDEQLSEITIDCKGKSKAAKLRWEKYRAKKLDNNTSTDAVQESNGALQKSNGAMQNDAEKRREEESREDKSIKTNVENPKTDFDFNISKCLEFINKAFGKQYRSINAVTQKKYKDLLKQYGWRDVSSAILAVKDDKFHIESKYKYATPEFFTRPKTMDMYAFSSISEPEYQGEDKKLVNHVNAYVKATQA